MSLIKRALPEDIDVTLESIPPGMSPDEFLREYQPFDLSDEHDCKLSNDSGCSHPSHIGD